MLDVSSRPSDTTELASPRLALRRRATPDVAAVGLLLALTGLIAWNRSIFDMWMARVDVLQQLMPYYTFLGRQLSDFNIPGWNPYQLAGMPFAADPLSGWMQLPVMVLFTIFDPVVAFKLLVTFNVGLGAVATYAFARVLGMGVPAGLVGGVAFAFGSLVHFNTYCCNIMGNFAPWIPVSLLGIEVAVRSRTWQTRAAAVSLAGLGLSQMLAAWIGQGTYYGLMILGAYVFYRAVLSPPGPWTAQRRITTAVIVGGALLAAGFGLAAAGLLPRLDVNRFTNLRGGNYAALNDASSRGWSIGRLFDEILSPNLVSRRVYLGTAVLMLAILAPVVARRRFAVPFFAVLTLVGLALMLDPNPVHHVLYLIPRFESLHGHSEYRIVGALLIGPAMLAAAAVEGLQRLRVQPTTLWLGLLPAGVLVLIGLYLSSRDAQISGWVWITVLLMTVFLLGWLVLRLEPGWHPWPPLRRLAPVFPVLIILLLVLDPAGRDIAKSIRGSTSPRGDYNILLATQEQRHDLVEVYTRCSDPGGAGEFLAQQVAAQGAPIRYFGYDAIDLRYRGRPDDDGVEPVAYHGPQARFQNLLVGMRATCLGLYDVQGYSPVQLQRYVDLLRAINGVELNYHDGAILPFGFDSPLLPLLNPAYVITPLIIPAERPDLIRVVDTMTEVFRNDQIRIFQNPRALPHAWAVHEARQVPGEQILSELASGGVDPRQTVLLEEAPPRLQPLPAGSTDSVAFTSYEPDEMALDVQMGSDGMLVLSEIYAIGWKAYVDGHEVPIVAADYALRGVAVPAGAHTVELRYELTSLRIGLWISLLTGLAMLGAMLAAAWQVARARAWRLDAVPADSPTRRLADSNQPEPPASLRAIVRAMVPADVASEWRLDRDERLDLALTRPTGIAWRWDLAAVAVLALLSFAFWRMRVSLIDSYFRGDILTQFLPYYTEVAERIKDGDIPGWNPAIFSGMPFAGDPISGWGYLPVIVSFILFAPLTAYKFHVFFHIVVAGVAVYLLARNLKMGPLGALAAGIAFILSPHYQYTQCCTARMQLGPWIPLGLLTIELAIKTRNLAVRVAWWGATGFIISQMIAGYFGKGMYYGVLLLGAFLAYRTLLDPPLSDQPSAVSRQPKSVMLHRGLNFAMHSVVVLGLGGGFSAVTLLPRLDFLDRANLAGGTYEVVAPGAVDPPAWSLAQALSTILDPERPAYFLGAATVALAIAGAVLCGRRFAVPFFAIFSVCVVILTLGTTPLHHLMYLLPKFKVIHEHEPQRVLVVLNIGPAMLAGAAVAAVEQRLVRPWKLAILALAPLLVTVVVTLIVDNGGRDLSTDLAKAAGLTLVLLVATAALTQLTPQERWRGWYPRVAAAVLVFFLFANLDAGRLRAAMEDGFETVPPNDLAVSFADRLDAGGAGGFLRERQAEGEYFRYFGYNDAFLSYEDDYQRDNYRSQWREPLAEAMLLNNRAIALDLGDIQGYNPVHYMDYLRLMDAVNGRTQEYHETNVLPSGLNSPLLALLNIRYVIVPLNPSEGTGREDYDYLTSAYPEVFRDGQVRVLEIPNAMPRAWVVHEARQVKDEMIFPMIADRAVDPRQTVLLTTSPPAMEPLPAGAGDQVQITSYEPDELRLTATMASAGMLVLSEIYDPGWQVYVDGERATLHQADGLLRGIALSAGTHEIELRFRPASIAQGLALTAATAALTLVVILALWWRQPEEWLATARRLTRR